MNEPKCKRCNSICSGPWIQRLSNRNVSHLYRLCSRCDTGRSNNVPINVHTFMRQSIDMVIDDRCQPCLGQGCPACEVNPCVYQGCLTPHHLVESHHWAPKYKFPDADNYGTRRLCKQHHNEWHKKMGL